MPSSKWKKRDEQQQLISTAKQCKKLTEFFNKRPESESVADTELQFDNTLQDGLGLVVPVDTVDSDSSGDNTEQIELIESSEKPKPAERLSDDLGNFIDATMSVDEITTNIKDMSGAQTLHLLQKHFRPDSRYAFPAGYMNGCNRSFKYSWMEKYPWIVYSPKLDGVFCIYCALFTKDRNSRGSLINQPFTKWTRSSHVFKDHGCFKSHINAITDAETYQECLKHSDRALPVILEKKREAMIQENREVLTCIVEAFVFCGKQCIALRGQAEKSEDTGNPGNFLAILRLMSRNNATLSHHLSDAKQKNAKYISPDIQNQLINIIGEDILQAKLIEEVRNAKLYSIMADEVTTHNKEQLSLCLRFVDNEKNVREEFLAFVSVTRITGEALANTILTTLQNLGLSIDNLRGQGYDGTASMSSNAVGVQAMIRQEATLAVYTHCSSHCLNLVLAHASSLTPVRNMLDNLKETSLFFNSSPKREALLTNVIHTCNPHDTARRKSLLDLCKTRWAERHKAYQHFYQAYTYIVKCLEVIAFGLHSDEGFDDDLAKNGNWDENSKVRASSLLSSLCDFQFIITFVTVYKLLSRLQGITVLLQKEASDIVSAVSMIDDVKQEYQEIRRNFDKYFDGVFKHAVDMAAAVGTEPTAPRIAKKQVHRDNTESNGPLQYYLRNIAILFIDHVITELDAQFSEISTKASKLLALVPSVFLAHDATVGYEDIKACAELYKEDLPCPEVLEDELLGWQLKFKKVDSGNLPKNCPEALKNDNEVQFPNIFCLLKIACIIPVTSCICERSFSAMRRLNNYMRCSMGQDQLSSLAMLHIHYSTDIVY